MAMEDEYDPFDVGGQGYVADTRGYQASKGTAASQLGYDASSVYNDDSNSTYATKVNRGMSDGRGLNFDQFKTRFGMSSTNPFGQTGFTKFMSKFGAKPNYTRQLSNLPRQGTTFRGNTLRTDAKGKVLGSVSRNPITGEETILPGVDAATYNAPGAVAERIMQQQYDAYRNPFNLKDRDDYDPRYDTATSEEIAAGKITRGGRTDRGSYLGPLEEVARPQSTGEMIARAAMPMGTGFLDTTDTYLSSAVTPEMRARGPQSLLGKAFQGATGVDPAQFDSKARSLGDGIRSLISGRETPAPVVDMTNRAGSMVPAAEEGVLPQGSMYEENVGNPNYLADNNLEMEFVLEGSNLPENQQFNRDMIEQAAYEGEPIFRSSQDTGYDFSDAMIRDIGTPISVPESLAIARANEGLAMGPTEAGVPVPAPRPDRTSPEFEEEFFTRTNFQDPDMDALASYRGSQATETPSDFTASFADVNDPRGNQMAPTPGEGYGMFGPRSPEDLRSMGIEPTAQDLMDMQLSPSQILQENLRSRELPSVGPVDQTLNNDLLAYAEAMEAAGTPMVAATSSLDSFVENNPGIGEALLNSREGQQLNDIFKFGGMKPETSDVFVDTEAGEIRVEGTDFRGRNKGFTIDASEFFGKIDLGELVSDTLKKGGMLGLKESQRERSERMNREFLEGLDDESERRAAEQGGIFSNIGYRG